MNITKASFSDIPTIRKIVNITWPHTYGASLSKEQIAYMLANIYSEEALNEQFSHPDHVFLLAEEDGIVYGFAGIQFNYPAEGTTKLNKIYILPSAQGKNIGRTLIGHILQLAAAEQQSDLLLNVNRYNKARQFYEKIGFSVVREENIDIGNGYLMEDYVMNYPLTKTI